MIRLHSVFLFVTAALLLTQGQANATLLELNDDNIHEAVDEWFSSRDDAETKYGKIQDWDTSRVRNMHSLFKGRSKFNTDISKWDTKSVVNMGYMFNQASAFNQDLPWDTSNVVFMDGVFNFATSFNGDISSWNTAKVKSMDFSFSHAESFNSDISSWDTSELKFLAFTFWNATSFSQDLSRWDVTQVEDLSRTFYNAVSFDQTLCWNINLEDQSLASRAFCGSPGSFDPTCVSPEILYLSNCVDSHLTTTGGEEGALQFLESLDGKISSEVHSDEGAKEVHETVAAGLDFLEEHNPVDPDSQRDDDDTGDQTASAADGSNDSDQSIANTRDNKNDENKPDLSIGSLSPVDTMSKITYPPLLESDASQNDEESHSWLKFTAFGVLAGSLVFMLLLSIFVVWKRNQIIRARATPADADTVVDTDSVAGVWEGTIVFEDMD